MSRFILDTDHLTLLQQGHPTLLARVAATPADDLAITIVTAEEQLRGWLDAIRKHGSSNRQIWAYQGLRDAIHSFTTLAILDFDALAYQQFRSLRHEHPRIGSQDVRIAAIVMVDGGVLLTRNRRDFGRISGLLIEDWTTT